MPQKQLFCLLLLIGCFTGSLYAQDVTTRDSVVIVNDSLRLNETAIINSADSLSLSSDRDFLNNVKKHTDSIAASNDKSKMRLVLKDSLPKGNIEFKPSPKKAVIYSAVFPGLGQIYNRKYWKLPIVYGGTIGIIYAISWNGRMYNDYMQAYKDLSTMTGKSYLNFAPEDKIMSERQRYIEIFRGNKNMFRQNRDLAIICAFGLYGLCMLDAYVDAQLYDFDISPDLSMKVMPIIFERTSFSERSIGVQLSFNF